MDQTRRGLNGVVNRTQTNNKTGTAIVGADLEAREILMAAEDYRDLMSRPGWKRLLDDLESRADRALGVLKQTHPGDPNVLMATKIMWTEAEDTITFIERMAGEALDRAKNLVTYGQTEPPTIQAIHGVNGFGTNGHDTAFPVFDDSDGDIDL